MCDKPLTVLDRYLKFMRVAVSVASIVISFFVGMGSAIIVPMYIINSMIVGGSVPLLAILVGVAVGIVMVSTVIFFIKETVEWASRHDYI